MAAYNTEVRFSKALMETFSDFAFDDHEQKIINWMDSILSSSLKLRLELERSSKVTIRLYVGYSSSKHLFSYESRVDVDDDFIPIPIHEFKLEEYENEALINEDIYDTNKPDLLYSISLEPDKPMSPYHITYPVTWAGTINNQEVVIVQRDQPSYSDIHFDFSVYPNEFDSIKDNVVELIDNKLHRLLD